MARKFIIILAIAIIVPNLVLVGFVLLGGKTTEEKPMPKPNGYEDLIKAALMISQQSNAITANLVREALTNECRMPIEYSEAFTSNGINHLASFKSLEQLLVAQGKAAEDAGRTNEALQWYLDGVRFGQEVQRGGLLITRLVGIACETIAVTRLTSLELNLDSSNCRALAKQLEALDAREEPVQECLETETRWAKRTFGIKGQIAALMTYKMERTSRTNFLSKDNRRALQRRQLIIATAARAYTLEKGNAPVKTADLVPDYLKAVPKDPVAGQALGL